MREFFDDQEDEKVADQIEEENSNAAEEDANDKAAQQDEIADSGRSGASMDIGEEEEQQEEEDNNNLKKKKEKNDKEDSNDRSNEELNNDAKNAEDLSDEANANIEDASGPKESASTNTGDMTTGKVPKEPEGTPSDTDPTASQGSPGRETPGNSESLPTDSSASTAEAQGTQPQQLGQGELGPGNGSGTVGTETMPAQAAETGAANTGAGAAEGGSVAGGATAGAEGTTASGAAAGGAAGAEGAAAGAGGATAGAGGAAAGAGAGTALGIAAIVILIIIALIGVAGFFMTMPQFLWNKLKSMALGLWEGFAGYFVGMDEATVHDDDIKAVAQYLNDMGYDLVGMGFAESVNLNERDKVSGKLKDEDAEENQILDIDAPYLKSYLVAENRTYMINNYTFNISDAVASIFKTGTFFNEGVSTWGTGLIQLEPSLCEGLAMPLKSIRIGDINVGELIDGVKVERSTNTLRIRRFKFDWFKSHNDYTYYSLAGWSGRYGKPFELLVTLHIATMAPDLVKEFAMNDALDAKVNIKLRKSDFNGKVYVDGKSLDEIETAGTYSPETIETLRTLENDNTSEIKTKIPYISSVTKHWFRNVYFQGTDSEGASGDTDIGVDDDEDGIEDYSSVDKTTRKKTQKVRKLTIDDDVYRFGGESAESEFDYTGDDLPAEVEGKVTIRGSYSDGVTQNKDAVRGVTNKTTKELFEQKYYIYDGTVERAEKIQEARKKNDETLKQNVKMTKESLSAFTILEESETLDAQYIYRDLKELVIELGYFEREDFNSHEMKVLEWPVPDYFPGDWPNRKIEKQHVEYGTLIACQETVANSLGISVEDLQKLIGETEEEDEEEREKDLLKSLKNVVFVGDDDIEGLKNSGVIEHDENNEKFYGKTEKTADYWLDNIANLPSKASQIVVYTGLNNPYDIQVMKDFIDALRKKYDKSKIYIVEVLHVSKSYPNADVINRQIDKYNSQIRIKCRDIDKVKVLKTAEGLVTKGYLTSTSDGKHINNYEKWALNIAEGILDRKDISKSDVDEQFVVDFLENAKETTKYLKENNYEYGNADFVPPKDDGTTTESGQKVMNGANMVSWALYKSGYKDFGEEGLTVGEKGNFISYCEDKKWKKINNASSLQPGDIVFCGQLDDEGKQAKSVYICAGTNKRYDCNSADKMKQDQPLEEGTAGDFMCAYRVKGDRAINSGFKKDLDVVSMCNGTITKIYAKGENVFSEGYLSSQVYGEDLTEENEEIFKPSEATDEGIRIKISDKNLKNYELVMYGFNVYDGLGEGQEIEVGEIIGETLKSDICLILIDRDKSVIENIEDYMKIPKKLKNQREEIEWEFYYWLPYESGPLGQEGVPSENGAGACGTVSGPNEVAVGIAQWTTIPGGCNNIKDLCAWLYEQDPGLCGPLQVFGTYSETQIVGSLDSLKAAWKQVNESDTDRFLELQMQYFYEVEYKGWLEQFHTEWLLDKSLVAQGTYASLMNWGPHLGWEKVINESMSDEAICKALLTKALPIGSTCGTLEARWNSQWVLARDILNGTFTDVEEWIRTKQPSDIYGEGQNAGALGLVRIKYYMDTFSGAYISEIKRMLVGGIYA